MHGRSDSSRSHLALCWTELETCLPDCSFGRAAEAWLRYKCCCIQASQAKPDAEAAVKLLVSKAELLRECVGLGINQHGCLTHLPVLCVLA